MDNNIIISSKGRSSTSQSLIVSCIVLAIAIIIGIGIAVMMDDPEYQYSLYKFAGRDRDAAQIFEYIIIALPFILGLAGVIGLISGFVYKKVYIDIYSDHVQGCFVNSKGMTEEPVFIMLKDIISVTGTSGAVKLTTVGGVYQVTLDKAMKNEIINHLNRAIPEAKANVG